MHFGFHYEKRISGKTNLEIGPAITHFSNGSYSLPNLGINIATFNLAFSHSFGQPQKRVRNEMPESLDRGLQMHTYVGGFYKKIYPPLGRSFFAGTISGMYFKPLNLKSALGLGMDVFYDNSLSARINKVGEKEAKGIDNFRPGIYGAYHLSVNKLGIMFNMGYYVYTSWKEDGNIYHRISLRYYFEKIFICLNLKTHYARADFVEAGVGYRFRKK
jgi:hypothetical protein